MRRIIPSSKDSLIFCTVLLVLCTENYRFLIFGQNIESRKKGKANITDIMKRTGTLKLSRRFDRYYSRVLEEFRDMQGVRILEIGADSGRSMMVSLVFYLRKVSTPAEYFALHAVVG